MLILGLQKLTLLDYPGRTACTVFTGGCNFRCPFCHNAPLVIPGRAQEPYTEEEVLSYLKKRAGLLDGVCVTGGEPTLQEDLEAFLRQVRALGYPVKLDTNGSRPEVLRALLRQGLADYVAMDVKSSPEEYARACGVPVDLEKVNESIDLLLSGRVDFVGINVPVLNAYLQEHPDAAGKVKEAFVIPNSEDVIAIPVRKGEPEFLDAINAALAELREEGTLKEISEKYLGGDYTNSAYSN